MRCVYGSGPPWGQSLQWIISQSGLLLPPSAPPHHLWRIHVSPCLVWDSLRTPCPLPWKVLLHLQTRNSQDAFLWRKPFTSIEIQLPLAWMKPWGRLVSFTSDCAPQVLSSFRAWGDKRGEKLTCMLPKAQDRRTVRWVCWFPKDPSAALPRESP